MPPFLHKGTNQTADPEDGLQKSEEECCCSVDSFHSHSATCRPLGQSEGLL